MVNARTVRDAGFALKTQGSLANGFTPRLPRDPPRAQRRRGFHSCILKIAKVWALVSSLASMKISCFDDGRHASLNHSSVIGGCVQYPRSGSSSKESFEFKGPSLPGSPTALREYDILRRRWDLVYRCDP